MKLISIKDACEKLSVGRTTLWTLTKQPEFPRLVAVTTNRRAFVEAELDAWISARAAERAA